MPDGASASTRSSAATTASIRFDDSIAPLRSKAAPESRATVRLARWCIMNHAPALNDVLLRWSSDRCASRPSRPGWRGRPRRPRGTAVASRGDLGTRRVARRRRGAPSAAGRRPLVESRWLRRGHVPPRDGGRVRVVRRLRDLRDGRLALELCLRAGRDPRADRRPGKPASWCGQGESRGRFTIVRGRGRDSAGGNERSALPNGSLLRKYRKVAD